MTQENAPTAVAETAEPQQQFFGDAIDVALANAFANDSTVEQVENSEQIETVKEEIPEVAEPETAKETEKEEEDTDVKVEETPAETETEGKADFDALEGKTPDTEKTVEYPDVETLKAKYPRQSKEFYAEAAQFAQEAKKGSEFISQIGGEEFITPMANIAKGIKESNTVQIFQGLAEASGQDAVLDVIGNGMFLALTKVQSFQDDPNNKEFGDRLAQVTNAVLAKKFGEDTTLEKLESLVSYDKIGWLEAIDKWKERGFVDLDEFDELLDADKQPEVFLNLKKQAQAESEQRLAAEAKLKEVETVKQSQVEIDFDKQNTESLEKVLNEVVWKRSVLKDLETDTAELKEEKSILRDILKADAIEHFNSSPNRQAVFDAYKRGEQNTPAFKQFLTTSVSSAILQTKEKTGVFERIIAKLYGNTRNGQIAKSVKSTSSNEPKLQPTQPTQVVNNKPRTTQEIENELAQYF